MLLTASTLVFLSLWDSIITLVFIFFVIGLFVYQIFKKKPKNEKKKQTMDPTVVLTFISLLGEKENIEQIVQDGSRTKVYVKDIEKCNLEQLKNEGVQNLFVTGNTLKMICPFDTEMLIDSINQD